MTAAATCVVLSGTLKILLLLRFFEAKKWELRWVGLTIIISKGGCRSSLLVLHHADQNYRQAIHHPRGRLAQSSTNHNDKCTRRWYYSSLGLFLPFSMSKIAWIVGRKCAYGSCSTIRGRSCSCLQRPIVGILQCSDLQSKAWTRIPPTLEIEVDENQKVEEIKNTGFYLLLVREYWLWRLLSSYYTS